VTKVQPGKRIVSGKRKETQKERLSKGPIRLSFELKMAVALPFSEDEERRGGNEKDEKRRWGGF